jgi:hypothetical protein
LNFENYSQTIIATGGTGTKTFDLATDPLIGLSLSPAGVLSGKPTTKGTSSFSVRVTDSAGATTTKSFTVTINDVVSITTTTLRQWTINAAGYNQSISGTGGTGALAFSVSLGSLPGGLALSSSGALTGKPTAASSFTFTVKAMDSVGASSTADFTLVIHPAVTITPTTLPKGIFNLSGYSKTLEATGGTGTITFGITTGSLPNGLTISAAGLISGTPLAAGTFPFTVTATDTVGGIGTMEFKFTPLGLGGSLLIDAVIPTVVNPVSSMITGTTAVVGGDITSTGGNTISAQGVVLAPTAASKPPAIGGPGVIRVVGTLGGVGPFTVSASGLKPGTSYAFAAYATNSVGTSYSGVGSFTTLSNVATLSKLVLSSGAIVPAFASNTFNYKAKTTVPFITDAVTVTPTTTLTSAAIKVEGLNVLSGTASAAIPLTVGKNILRNWSFTVRMMESPTKVPP